MPLKCLQRIRKTISESEYQAIKNPVGIAQKFLKPLANWLGSSDEPSIRNEKGNILDSHPCFE